MEIYQKIKSKILQHTETRQEKQLRVRNEWSELHRSPTESLLDFEARWDDKLKKMMINTKMLKFITM